MKIYLAHRFTEGKFCFKLNAMADENTPNPYAKGIEAGMKKPAPILEGMKSAWHSIKTDVGSLFEDKPKSNDFSDEEMAASLAESRRKK